MSLSSRDLKQLIPAIYLVALFLIVAPYLNELIKVWPFLPSDAGWRFGAFGFLLNAATTPLLGFALLAGVALATSSATALRSTAVGAGLLAAVLVVLLLVFMRDAGQLVANLSGLMQQQARVALWRTVLVSLFCLPVLSWLAIGAWRASSGIRATLSATARSSSGLVVGS